MKIPRKPQRASSKVNLLLAKLLETKSRELLEYDRLLDWVTKNPHDYTDNFWLYNKMCQRLQSLDYCIEMLCHERY